MSMRAIVNYHIKSPDQQAFKFDVDGIIGNLVSSELMIRMQIENRLAMFIMIKGSTSIK